MLVHYASHEAKRYSEEEVLKGLGITPILILAVESVPFHHPHQFCGALWQQQSGTDVKSVHPMHNKKEEIREADLGVSRTAFHIDKCFYDSINVATARCGAVALYLALWTRQMRPSVFTWKIPWGKWSEGKQINWMSVRGEQKPEGPVCWPNLDKLDKTISALKVLMGEKRESG